VRALIVAGGEGTRLRPYTETIPKPMLPLLGRPLLEHTVARLARSGFDRITMAVRHRAESITSHFGDGDEWGVAIDYLVERTALGTAGCLAALDDVIEDRLLLCNGDIVTTEDLADVYRAHRLPAGLTLLAASVPVRMPYGVLRSTEDGTLVSYDEKPVLRYQIATGVSVVSSAALAALPRPARRLDVPDLVRHLRSVGFTPRVLATDADWVDVGTPADVARAEHILAGAPPQELVLSANGGQRSVEGEEGHE
jgi:NDP-mannose synthase